MLCRSRESLAFYSRGLGISKLLVPTLHRQRKAMVSAVRLNRNESLQINCGLMPRTRKHVTPSLGLSYWPALPVVICTKCVIWFSEPVRVRLVANKAQTRDTLDKILNRNQKKPVFVLIVRIRRSSKTNFRKMLAHLPISPRVLDFLVLTKMIAASGNEIAKGVETFELLFKFNIFE